MYASERRAGVQLILHNKPVSQLNERELSQATERSHQEEQSVVLYNFRGKRVVRCLKGTQVHIFLRMTCSVPVHIAAIVAGSVHCAASSTTQTLNCFVANFSQVEEIVI
jgi:hypothetical protein